MDLSVVDLMHIIDGHARQVSKAMESPHVNTEALKSHVARMYGLVEKLHEIAVASQQASNGAEEAKAN